MMNTRYHNVASSRPVYYSILNSLGQRSHYISIRFFNPRQRLSQWFRAIRMWFMSYGFSHIKVQKEIGKSKWSLKNSNSYDHDLKSRSKSLWKFQKPHQMSLKKNKLIICTRLKKIQRKSMGLFEKLYQTNEEVYYHCALCRSNFFGPKMLKKILKFENDM